MGEEEEEDETWEEDEDYEDEDYEWEDTGGGEWRETWMGTSAKRNY